MEPPERPKYPPDEQARDLSLYKKGESITSRVNRAQNRKVPLQAWVRGCKKASETAVAIAEAMPGAGEDRREEKRREDEVRRSEAK